MGWVFQAICFVALPKPESRSRDHAGLAQGSQVEAGNGLFAPNLLAA
jgi:hypothetical protein